MWWKMIVLLGLPMLLVLACGSDSDEPFTIGAMDALTGVAESYGNPCIRPNCLPWRRSTRPVVSTVGS